MALPVSDSLCEIDTDVRQALLSVYEEHIGRISDAKITFRAWIPAGARTIKQRRFTLLSADNSPAIICKIPLDSDDHKVTGEWHKLQGLSLPPAVHRAHGLRQVGAGFIMTFIPELDLPDALGHCTDRAVCTALLERAIDLIAQLHLHDTGDAPPTDSWTAARQYVDQPCTARPQLRAAIESALIGPTHSDLAPWNIRYDRAADRLSIIDWEDYRQRGITGIDVVNLLVTLGLVVFPEYRSRGMAWLYEQVLESDHWYALLVRDMIVRYAAAIGRPARLIIDLLPFFCQWLIHRISSEGRDTSSLYYDYFLKRYAASAPAWVSRLPDE